MTHTYDDHVLVVERCHPPGKCPMTEAADSLCWEPEWEVLHPPTCCHPNELADEGQPGPDYRCGLDMDLSYRGDDAFDLVDAHPVVAEPYGIGDLLPAGRYLCRWWNEPPSHQWSDDGRSGIELVEGPVWLGDRVGWDRDPYVSDVNHKESA